MEYEGPHLTCIAQGENKNVLSSKTIISPFHQTKTNFISRKVSLVDGGIGPGLVGPLRQIPSYQKKNEEGSG